MNHIRWAAWGVIDIDDASKFDRMQRRNYIKRTRADLDEKNVTLYCGGSTAQPWYAIDIPEGVAEKRIKQAFAGKDAFKKVCAWLLEKLGEHNVSGADGGVRSAGAEVNVAEIVDRS